MKLSVIIPTYHRNDLLKLCLEALSPKKQSLSEDCYEVIVTDDGKEFNAKKMIESNFKWCKWVQGPQKGPASNRNFGASQASNEWLVYIDDDCIPDENLLMAYLTNIKNNPDEKVFEGCIKADREKMSFYEESPVNLSGGYLWGCNFMIDKVFFYDLAGFDEKFPSAAMEDVDLRERIIESGENLFFVEKAFVIHPWRKSKNLNFVKKRHDSFVYFAQKNVKFRRKQNLFNFLNIYLRSLIYLLKNAINYRFRGFFSFIIQINYDFILKMKYLITK